MSFGNEVHMYKGMGVSYFADFIPFFLNIPWKWNILVSLRPNYLIFYRISKNGRGFQENPLFAYWVILHVFFLSLLDFKISFFEKFSQEYNQIVKRFGSRLGPTFCRVWSGSNLRRFSNVISRRHQERQSVNRLLQWIVKKTFCNH